jgi:hypothetical protein
MFLTRHFHLRAVDISYLYNDKDSDITLSRKLARFLSKFSWYYPLKEGVRPSLDDAWAYFEHSTLARYHIQNNDDDQFLKAEPGESKKPTRLYPVLSTPEKDLADFGVGAGIYFWTLRMLSIILFIAGLMSSPNFLYFWSEDYNSVEEHSKYEVLRSSAICTDQPWKACPSCTRSQFDYFPATFDRYAEAVTDDGTKLTFIRINDCYISREAGVVSCIVMLFVCISIYIMSQVAKRKEQSFDDAEQTASDYSVVVRNPPVDAKDPNEWYRFFSQFGHVTSITIALANKDLLTNLLERRQLVSGLEDILPPEVEVDVQNIDQGVWNKTFPVPWYWKLLGSIDGSTIHKKIAAIEDLIEGDLSKKEYDVSEVFVVYEKEASQQKALKTLQIPRLQVLRNNVSALPQKEYVFRGTHVLRVVEPPEPSSVRWPELDKSFIVGICMGYACLLKRVSSSSANAFLACTGSGEAKGHFILRDSAFYFVRLRVCYLRQVEVRDNLFCSSSHCK